MIKDKVTIVLTLKDRAEFTYRWMTYMHDNKCKYPILIADGGSDTEIENNLKDHKNYPDLNYRYLRFPQDSNINVFFNKIYSVTNLVETDYLIFADNDDFFDLNAIDTCISFLENNTDYVSCCGKRVFLKLYSDSGTVLNAPKGRYSTLTTYENNRRSIEHDSSLQRIKYFFDYVDKDSLWMKHYAVTRSCEVKSALEVIQEKNFNDLNSFELFLNSRILGAGKHKELDFVYYIRQEGTSQATRDLNLQSNLVERFLLGSGFTDFIGSIPYIDKKLALEDELKIRSYFVSWLVAHGYAIYNKKESTPRKFIKNILTKYVHYNLTYCMIRVFSIVKNVFSAKRVYYINLPMLDKYTLSH